MSIEPETHETHHLFIRRLIDKEERRQKLVDGVVEQVLGWGAISFLIAIGAGVYEVIHHFFTNK